MDDAGTRVLERHIEPPVFRPDRHEDRRTKWRPSTAERWLLPLMWVAIAIVTAVTTPAAAADPPIAQLVIGELLGWIGLAAMMGLALAALAGRSSLHVWSLALGGVTAIGLAACQMFGHPVFSSAWGLSQVALVSTGVFLSGRTISHRLS